VVPPPAHAGPGLKHAALPAWLELLAISITTGVLPKRCPRTGPPGEVGTGRTTNETWVTVSALLKDGTRYGSLKGVGGSLIEIRAQGPEAEQELRSLKAWLQDEDEVRHHAQISMVPEQPKPGELGSVWDTILLVVDDGFEALNFALAYVAWRATRSDRPRVTIERHGTKLTVDDADPDVVDKIVRALE
jgi:Effector Associated Constant Component 1